ncbi:MAG: hypothetical protein M1833_005102 [Piccolia ochrophora]|nr:MAG: hypothetical protein M1833_005102 [Piccolia ochrophora]
MDIPTLVPYPPPDVRKSLSQQEWALCIESWTALTTLYLRLPQDRFTTFISITPSLPAFLTSYVAPGPSPRKAKEIARDQIDATGLRRNVFLLTHRCLAETDPIPSELISPNFLLRLCAVFPRSRALKTLLETSWRKNLSKIEKELQAVKLDFVRRLDAAPQSNDFDDLEGLMHDLNGLFFTSFDTARFFMAGSDYLESLYAGYASQNHVLRKHIIANTYLGLVSLTQGEQPNISLLSDHLYDLKTKADSHDKSNSANTFLTDLATNTPLLSHLRTRIAGPNEARAKRLLTALEPYQKGGAVRPKRLVKRKINKGKGIPNGGLSEDEYGHGAFGASQVHRMSLITQIQDLFPDLGAGFVARLLEEYHDDVEQVTAHLLDESLPAHLQKADRMEELQNSSSKPRAPPKHNLAPRSTPPPPQSHGNFEDEDELDNLTVDASRLHIGRRNPTETADSLLNDRSKAPSKSAILSALAAFDPDDDEHDDTYDMSDVGGTVDNAAPTAADDVDADLRDHNEAPLYSAYRLSPAVFDRDAAARRGKARAALRSETGMTDAAIEGWAIMLQRDPSNLRRLEAKYATFGGGQRELAGTAWRGGGDMEESDGVGSGRDGFPQSGRGPRGRGGRGRGRGNVAGPAGERSTEAERRRKEANKGSRANHQRRDQRARKMARGGL